MGMRARFLREVAAAGLPAGPGPTAPVQEADLAPLPEPARRYLRFMGVPGRPRDWSFRVSFAGRFRFGAAQPWRKVETWQYNSSLDVARIFHMRMRFGPVPLLGRDTYLRGRGRMVGKVLDLFTVVDGSGPEYDVGELVTWLNDAILFAPSMLLGPATAWSRVDEGSFDVALTDRDRTVRARVLVDGRGAVRDFSTTDRFYSEPGRPPFRARWSTPIEGWQALDGRPVFSGGQAVWHLQQGDLPYADFRLVPGTLAFDVPPGE
jgi:hypothetical protein